MIRKLAVVAILAAIAGGLTFFFLTSAGGLDRETLAALPGGDAASGETVFWAGGCASCHAAETAEGGDRLKLGGGLVLKTDFGDFVAPNISPHAEDGIGNWSRDDFANAMREGVSPEGYHYYPSFPYGSYTRMADADLSNLWAFWQTLPEVEGKAPDHDLAFPFNIRRGVGLWKLLHLDPSPVVAVDAGDEVLARGRYLVEGLGHCGECHTPRDLSGGLKRGRWLAGAPNPDGKGRIPNITGGEGGIGSWSAADVAYYLETGFTPDFDSVGGSMADVQRNIAMLTGDDRAAIAAYLKSIPEHADGG
jgi:mono/diheme cytochrome c family protein